MPECVRGVCQSGGVESPQRNLDDIAVPEPGPPSLLFSFRRIAE